MAWLNVMYQDMVTLAATLYWLEYWYKDFHFDQLKIENISVILPNPKQPCVGFIFHWLIYYNYFNYNLFRTIIFHINYCSMISTLYYFDLSDNSQHSRK